MQTAVLQFKNQSDEKKRILEACKVKRNNQKRMSESEMIEEYKREFLSFVEKRNAAGRDVKFRDYDDRKQM